MKLNTKLIKLLFGGKWYIAFRHTGSNEIYSICETPVKEFCADPFIINENRETYIFCEQYRIDKRKGCIGYFRFIDGLPVTEGIVIERPYHLSYPCVFKYKEKYFMIPETGENKTVEIYIADRFPDKWSLHKVLLSGRGYVDTTIVIENDYLTMITYYRDNERYILEKYALSEKLDHASFICKKRYNENIGRGAGAILVQSDGAVIRPTQNCKNSYGESIIFNKIIGFGDSYDETPVRLMKVEDINVDESIRKKNIVGLHTYASNDQYEIIDLFVRSFDCTYTIGNRIAKNKRVKQLMSDK
ncbi:MAG TPA: hypothetical protein PK854_07580 [Oscillospiraceae bacterium]|nr:hypothetical protein [Oscillospiraceae bacterium]HPS35111.1 hypothetical protein [Oscillospiraceae bacterium]